VSQQQSSTKQTSVQQSEQSTHWPLLVLQNNRFLLHRKFTAYAELKPVIVMRKTVMMQALCRAPAQQCKASIQQHAQKTESACRTFIGGFSVVENSEATIYVWRRRLGGLLQKEPMPQKIEELLVTDLERGRAGSAPRPPLGDGLTPSLTVMLANAIFWSFNCKTWHSEYSKWLPPAAFW